MTDLQSKQSIQIALRTFESEPLAKAATALFESLGYKSQKRIVLKPNTAKTFTHTFAKAKPLNPDHPLLGDWQSEDFLFQLTPEERDSLTSQIAISKPGRGDRRSLSPSLPRRSQTKAGEGERAGAARSSSSSFSFSSSVCPPTGVFKVQDSGVGFPISLTPRLSEVAEGPAYPLTV